MFLCLFPPEITEAGSRVFYIDSTQGRGYSRSPRRRDSRSPPRRDDRCANCPWPALSKLRNDAVGTPESSTRAHKQTVLTCYAAGVAIAPRPAGKLRGSSPSAPRLFGENPRASLPASKFVFLLAWLTRVPRRDDRRDDSPPRRGGRDGSAGGGRDGSGGRGRDGPPPSRR